ncbi:MAG: lipopolysaccharide biosynthesis protein [Muribaculaceae bacterium]|nr:lipopolysaccharide biosynthesis protein [Muribaculaceae bacterium]
MTATANLGRQTGRGMLWSGLETFGMTAASLVVSIWLARIVEPAAFGLIAMVQIFIAVGQVFADSGVSQALIRRPVRTRTLESAALFINMGTALLFYATLWGSAPAIARFYNTPSLCGIIRWAGLSIPLAGMCVVQTARLTAQMRFSRLALVNVVSTIAGGATGIILATKGFGIMSLIFMQLVMWVTRALLLWTICPWLPSLKLRRNEARSIVSFSWKLLVSALIDTIYVNMYASLLGMFFSATITAMYWRANSLASFVPQSFQGILSRVSLPAISRIRNDRHRTRGAYIKMISSSCWLIFPICAIGIALATPLFGWVLTDKWLPAVPLFRILALSMAFYPVHALNCSILNVYGRSDKFLILEICKKVVGVTALCITLPMGVTSLCYGILASSIICLVINILFAKPYATLGVLAQIKLMLPCMIMAIVAGAVAYIISNLFSDLYMQVLMGAAAGAIIYLLSTALSCPHIPRNMIALFRKE